MLFDSLEYLGTFELVGCPCQVVPLMCRVDGSGLMLMLPPLLFAASGGTHHNLPHQLRQKGFQECGMTR